MSLKTEVLLFCHLRSQIACKTCILVSGVLLATIFEFTKQPYRAILTAKMHHFLKELKNFLDILVRSSTFCSSSKFDECTRIFVR